MYKTAKIAIIGCGFVGSTTAFNILLEGLASELVLINEHKTLAMGHALDLRHGMEFLQSAKIKSGSEYSLVKGCDIIIITAGAHQEEGETRLDLLNKNAQIYKEIIPEIYKHNQEAIIIVVTNPVDVMTYLVTRYSKYPKHKVIGTGTSLDTARFRAFIGEHLKINPKSINAYILGEHGDSSFPIWSGAAVGGVKISEFKEMDKKTMEEVYTKTKNAAYEVISKKGATYFAIALTITKIVKAIITDSNEVIPISCFIENYYGINDVCISVPCVVNKEGIKKILKIDMNSSELDSFRRSANILKEARKNIELFVSNR